jgi:hypothetical protein
MRPGYRATRTFVGALRRSPFDARAAQHLDTFQIRVLNNIRSGCRQRPFSSAPNPVVAATAAVATPTVAYAPKPWLDGRRSLESRVRELLDVPTIHPADFHDPSMQDLVKQCCQQGDLEGMQLAQNVIDRLLVEKRRLQASGMNVFVPIHLIQTLLYGWAVLAADLRVAQGRMREVVQFAIDEAKQDVFFLGKKNSTELESQPNVQLFNTYLQGIVNAAKSAPNAALDGEAMIHQMSEYNRTLGWHTKPNTRSYTHVIMAYANTGHPGSGQRAYNLLQAMKQVHVSERAAYEREYSVAYNEKDFEANKRQIVTPDAAAYTSVMKALIESSRMLDKVLDLLNEAIQSESVILDEGLFTMAIKSLSRAIETERNAKIRISLAKQAEQILELMIRYAQTKSFSPTTISGNSENYPPLLSGYNACLDTWARAYCKEAAPQCNSILHRMMKGSDAKPDTVSFNTCLYGTFSIDKAVLVLLTFLMITTTWCLWL